MFPVHRDYPRSRHRPAVACRCAGTPAPVRLRALRVRPLARVLALAGVVLWSGACGPAERPGESIRPFPGSATSLEELGREVLGALATGDVAALEAYRLTEFEHNEVVWPELPASAPEVNFPVDMAWLNIDLRNQSALRRILPSYDLRRPVYERTECRGETQAFETFVVLTDCWVLFRLAGDVTPLEAQLFKDVLVRAGGHKTFRYYDEEPKSRLVTEAD